MEYRRNKKIKYIHKMIKYAGKSKITHTNPVILGQPGQRKDNVDNIAFGHRLPVHKQIMRNFARVCKFYIRFRFILNF